MSKVFNLLKRREPLEQHQSVYAYFTEIKLYGFGPEAMKQVKVCETCGKQASRYETICQKCRSVLPEKTLYDLYRMGHRQCRNCEAVVPDDADFCPICGKPVVSAGRTGH